MKLPAANGKLATIGFCWGGGQSFSAAAMNPPPRACVVYYGVAPDSAQILQVKAPVLAHYGGDDARVDATIDAAKSALAKQKVPYDPHVYPGAGHGFLRQQTMRDGANMKASEQSWPLTINFLIVAFCVFLVIKGMSVVQKRFEKEKESKPEEAPAEERLLTEIRDILKSQSTA